MSDGNGRGPTRRGRILEMILSGTAIPEIDSRARKALHPGEFSIRLATLSDIPELVAMGEKFISATPYGKLFRATGESLQALAQMLFNFGENAAILIAEDAVGIFGMLAIVASPHPLTGQLYADEVVWWVEETGRARRAGPALLDAAEDWARSRKCYMVKMVAPIPSTVGRFYERKGYAAVETAYAKVL